MLNLNIPIEVARKIIFERMHPVTAWRVYYGWSSEALAKMLGVPTTEVNTIENSNQHLKEDVLGALCTVFNIYPAALNYRHKYINQ